MIRCDRTVEGAVIELPAHVVMLRGSHTFGRDISGEDTRRWSLAKKGQTTARRRDEISPH